MPDLAQIDVELARLYRLIAAMESGLVVTHRGIDVTAQELSQLKRTLAYLDAVLFRFSHRVN